MPMKVVFILPSRTGMRTWSIKINSVSANVKMYKNIYV